jgi:hypothetical protein
MKRLFHKPTSQENGMKIKVGKTLDTNNGSLLLVIKRSSDEME